MTEYYVYYELDNEGYDCYNYFHVYAKDSKAALKEAIKAFKKQGITEENILCVSKEKFSEKDLYL